MFALVQTQDGFATELPTSSVLDTLDPYLSAERVPTPQAGRDEVVIRVRQAPINPSDVAFVKGVYGQPRVAGTPAGFEGVGDVVASGGGIIADRLVGRRVSFFAGISGSWAEYAVASSRTCVPLRRAVSDKDGAALLVNPFSAWAMCDIVRKDGAKSFVMTAAASQLGKLLTGLASEKGLRPISLVRRDEQIDPLLRLGAAHVLNTETPGFDDSFARVLKEERPRVLLDALGGPPSQSLFLAMGPRSRWIVYGGLDARPVTMPDPGQLIFQSKHIEGFWLTSWLQRGSLLRTVSAARGVQEKFASGEWSTEVAATVPLAEAHERVPALTDGPNQGKIMLIP